jgi:hypothetical protein
MRPGPALTTMSEQIPLVLAPAPTMRLDLLVFSSDFFEPFGI